jgi:hypothetical protein
VRDNKGLWWPHFACLPLLSGAITKCSRLDSSPLFYRIDDYLTHSSGGWEIQEHGTGVCLAPGKDLLIALYHSHKEQASYLRSFSSYKATKCHHGGSNHMTPSNPSYTSKTSKYHSHINLGIQFSTHKLLRNKFKPQLCSTIIPTINSLNSWMC